MKLHNLCCWLLLAGCAGSPQQPTDLHAPLVPEVAETAPVVRTATAALLKLSTTSQTRENPLEPMVKLDRFVLTKPNSGIRLAADGPRYPRSERRERELYLPVTDGKADGEGPVKAVHEAWGVALELWFDRAELYPKAQGVVPVFAKPDVASPAQMVIAPGEIPADIDVQAYERGDEFVPVTFENGLMFTGYVHREDLGVVAPRLDLRVDGLEHSFTESVEIRVTSSEDAEALGSASAMTPLKLLNSENGWAEVVAVRDSGAVHGFVPMEFVGGLGAGSFGTMGRGRGGGGGLQDYIEIPAGTKLHIAAGGPTVGAVLRTQKRVRVRQSNGWTQVEISTLWDTPNLWIEMTAP